MPRPFLALCLIALVACTPRGAITVMPEAAAVGNVREIFVGTTRVLRILDAGGGNQRDVTVTKADFEIDPISDRYGAKVITEGGKSYGYLNLRTFISSANPPIGGRTRTTAAMASVAAPK